MKATQFLKRTRKTFFIMAFTFLIVGVSQTNSYGQQQPTQQPTQQMYNISGNAAGSQVVPAVQGNGAGTFKGTFDPTTRQLNYTTTWDKLSGAPNSGGFYTGVSGSNGTAAGDAWTLGDNLTPTGTYSGKMTLTEQQAKDLLAGNWYYSYGTTTNSAGEVRGQMSVKPGGQ